MKKIKQISLAIIALITMISCEKKEENPVEENNTIQEESTKLEKQLLEELQRAKSELKQAEIDLQEAIRSGSEEAKEKAQKIRDNAYAAWESLSEKTNNTIHKTEAETKEIKADVQSKKEAMAEEYGQVKED